MWAFRPSINLQNRKCKEPQTPPQVDSSGQVSGNPTELNTVKIISDDNDISSDNTGLRGSENKTRVRIDPESQEVIIEVVNDKTGKEVRQIPGEQQLRLSRGISEYNNLAFNHDRPA